MKKILFNFLSVTVGNVIRYISLILLITLMGAISFATTKEYNLKPNICDTIRDTVNSCCTIFNNYDTAKREQGISQKFLLIYFTARHGVNYRKMENEVLGNLEVMELLNNYIFVRLDIDDRISGQKNLQFEESKYGNNAQPFFVIEKFEKVKSSIAGYTSERKFIEFLNEFK